MAASSSHLMDIFMTTLESSHDPEQRVNTKLLVSYLYQASCLFYYTVSMLKFMKSSYLLRRLWLFCILLIFAFCFFDEVRGQCLEHNKSLLLKFKRSLVIDDESHNSSKLANWIPRTDCCLWPGVTCSGTYVTGLDLGDEGVVGGFNESSSLFHLTSLTSLNLAMMQQNTVIPSGIERLVNLMNLNMSGSSFSGPIPIQISNLTRLVSLDLSYCYQLSANDPNSHMLVGNLSNLIDLRLSDIDLSSQSIEWCRTLSSSVPHLQVLDLSGCQLSGHITHSLMNLTQLSTIDISNNNFSSPIPYGVFASLENLTSLNLGYCGFNGVFPHRMLQLPTLRFLDISSNYLIEASPLVTFLNSSIETLLLSGTKFSKTIPESIGELRMLSHLDLRFCGLCGQIPNSISQLDRLVYLNMAYNNLVGRIPLFSRSRNLAALDLSYNHLNGSILATDWKKLSRMDSLMLRSNSLSGSIPAFLFEIPSLVTLDLEGNHFVGFTNESNIMASSSSHLQELNLRGNNLQGSIPPFIYGLTNLQILDLSYSHLIHKATVEIGGELPSFSQLYSLGLASCSLKEFPYFLRNQSKLEYLDLSDNQIDGGIPDWIWNMSALVNLNLSHNRLQLLGRQELGSGFEILDLSSNQFHGKLPNIPQSIKYLDLSRNLFSSSIPISIDSSFPNMRFFSLSSNKLHGSIPESICNATYLEVLDISINFLNGTLPRCLTQLSDLAVLNLRKNNISGTIPETLPSPCVLQTLDLSQNSFQGKIPKSLGGCLSLQAIDLGYNKLHDMFPCWMSNVHNVAVLVLRSNSLYGSIQCLNHNFNWSKLQILDISSNNFGGKLPSLGLLSWAAMMVDKSSTSGTSDLSYQQPYPKIMSYNLYGKLNFVAYYFMNTVLVTVKGNRWNLTKISNIFTLMDFSVNKFEGDIPREMGELKFLYVLNLSHNSLSGRIPPSFGNLYSIESLDLSQNELSGRIPGQLAALTFLSLLNLSFNHLDGMIPKGRQFQTFPEASFKGNKGLCGQPLSTRCGNEGVGSPSSEAEDKFGDGFEFSDIFIAAEIGYALGFGLIIMPLLFWSRWRNGYYECVDKVLMNIYCSQPKKSPLLPRKIRRRN